MLKICSKMSVFQNKLFAHVQRLNKEGGNFDVKPC